MSFLKNILGAFVELKDEKPSETQAAENVTEEAKVNAGNTIGISAGQAISGSSQSANVSAVAGSATVAAGFQKHFEDLIEEANTNNPLFQGTDFKEFIESKSDVDAITDEAMKYRTAFNVLKRTGLTKERLSTTGQEYIKIIDKDLSEFEKAYNQQYKVDVEDKELLLQRKAQELQALNEKITALNSEMGQMSADITQSKQKLTANKSSFVMAGESKKNEIKTELQKIDTYFS